jgi:hypothetical protein
MNNKRNMYYVDDGGILCSPNGRVMTPQDAADEINKQRLTICYLQHDLEIAERERDQARHALEEWKNDNDDNDDSFCDMY